MAQDKLPQKSNDLLEEQLKIYAREYSDKVINERELQTMIEALLASERSILTELREVYGLHKAFLEESIELLSNMRQAFARLSKHVSRRDITIMTADGTEWYQVFGALARDVNRALLRQKEALLPYLAEDWEPPSEQTWEGRLAKVANNSDR